VLLIPKTARLGAGLTVVWMTAVVLSHIFVLGYGWFFVDALTVMVLAVVYLLMTRRHSHWANPKVWGLRLPDKRKRERNSSAISGTGSGTEVSLVYLRPITLSYGGTRFRPFTNCAQLRLFIIDLRYSRETQNPVIEGRWGFDPSQHHSRSGTRHILLF
jgi:hypothetical protein